MPPRWQDMDLERIGIQSAFRLLSTHAPTAFSKTSRGSAPFINRTL
jgi:hypothetical protein